MKKKALITGISGQDGSYLSEYLLSKNYEVYGLIRRHSIVENQDNRINHLYKDIHTEYGDLLDVSSLERMFQTIKPDEIYNLAAMSHVGISFDIPQFTTQVNALGVVNVLESFRKFTPNSKLYQASSSEIFGDSVGLDGFQKEDTPKTPVSPYGCAKLFAFNIVRNYRKAYNLFLSNGILFNHGSPRRGGNFVEQKVVKNAVLIHYGIKDKLELGNLDSYRDWGHSKDYVKAMVKILNHSEPDDFVIATGKTYCVRDMCDYVFSKLNLDYKDYVVQNPKYLRPEELPYLRGDSTKAQSKLDWVPLYSFETMLDEMINYWLDFFSKKENIQQVEI